MFVGKNIELMEALVICMTLSPCDIFPCLHDTSCYNCIWVTVLSLWSWNVVLCYHWP